MKRGSPETWVQPELQDHLAHRGRPVHQVNQVIRVKWAPQVPQGRRGSLDRRVLRESRVLQEPPVPQDQWVYLALKGLWAL